MHIQRYRYKGIWNIYMPEAYAELVFYLDNTWWRACIKYVESDPDIALSSGHAIVTALIEANFKTMEDHNVEQTLDLENMQLKNPAALIITPKQSSW